MLIWSNPNSPNNDKKWNAVYAVLNNVHKAKRLKNFRNSKQKFLTFWAITLCERGAGGTVGVLVVQ